MCKLIIASPSKMKDKCLRASLSSPLKRVILGDEKYFVSYKAIPTNNNFCHRIPEQTTVGLLCHNSPGLFLSVYLLHQRHKLAYSS